MSQIARKVTTTNSRSRSKMVVFIVSLVFLQQNATKILGEKRKCQVIFQTKDWYRLW